MLLSARCIETSCRTAHPGCVTLTPRRCSSIPSRHVRFITRATNAENILGKLQDKTYLTEAAKRYKLGVEKGVDEDELINMELTGWGESELTDSAKQYKDKIKKRIAERADELAVEEKEYKEKVARTLMLGKEAYECGQYPAAVKLLERAVEELGENTEFGGEAQLWLALSYQACGREEDCIKLFKYIEDNHPMRKIKKQAESTRYILEAPKLEISEDERVRIELIQSDTWRKDRKSAYSSKTVKAAPKEVEGSYWDKATWEVKPPQLPGDKWYYQVAWVCVLLGATLYLNYAHKAGEL